MAQISTIDGLDAGISLPKILETNVTPDAIIEVIAGSQIAFDSTASQFYIAKGTTGSTWFKLGSVS